MKIKLQFLLENNFRVLVSRFILMIVWVILNGISLQAQTIKTVGNGGDYPTLQNAFTSINSGSITGAIILQIISSTNETGAVTLNASGSGSANYSSVLIYPTGSGYMIGSNLGSSLLTMNGARNVKIDGRVNAAGANISLTISNTNAGSSASTVTFINSASNNTIQYCTVKGSSTNQTGGVIFFSTSSSGEGNSDNTISNCDLTNAGNRPYNLIYSSGSASFLNSNNAISNNNIYDFLNYTGAWPFSFGINLGSSYDPITISNSTDWNITGNSFYETTTLVPSQSSSNYYAISINNSSGNNFTIKGNYIGGNAPLCSGEWIMNSSVYYFLGISMGVGTDKASNVESNTISGINLTTSNAYGFPGIFTGIYISSGSVNVGGTAVNSGNTIGATSGTGDILITSTSNSAFISGIYVGESEACNVKIRNNTVASIITGGGANTSYTFYGIYTWSSIASTFTITGNNIGNQTANSVAMGSDGTTSAATILVGIINSATGNIFITNNTIQNCSSFGSSALLNSSFIGISNSGAADSLNINYNTFTSNTLARNGGLYREISNTGAVKTAININHNTINSFTLDCRTMSGIYMISNTNAGPASTLYIDSNNISDIIVTTGATLYGIYAKIQGTGIIQNNNIHSISTNSVADQVEGFYGIQSLDLDGTNGNNCTISDNNINSIAMGTNGYTTEPTYLYGISNGTTGNVSIKGNTIQNCSSYGLASHSFSAILGISNGGSASSLDINNNTLSAITLIEPGQFFGITNWGSIKNMNSINNNTISTITLPYPPPSGTPGYSPGNGFITNTGGSNTSSLSISSNKISGTITFTGTVTSYPIISNSGIVLNSGINANNFENLVITSLGGTIYMIANTYTAPTGGSKTVKGNYISTSLNLNGGGAGKFYCYYDAGNSPSSVSHDISSNNFSNITISNTNSGGFNGIYSTDFATSNNPSLNVYNNTVFGVSCGTGTVNCIYINGFNGTIGSSNLVYGNYVGNITSASTLVYGLYLGLQSLFVNVNNNNINNLSTTGNGSGLIYGIYQAGGGATSVFNNQIYNLTSSGLNATAYGYYLNGGRTNNFYNNFISDIKAPTSANANAIAGMYLNGGTTNNIFYNTIYLNASSTGNGFGSSGLYSNTGPTLSLINNIIINNSIPGSVGYSAALRFNNASLANYSSVSNNNNLYAGTPGAGNLIFYNGSSYQRISDFQSLVDPRDASSLTENTPFVNTTSTPYNLHLSYMKPTLCESRGLRISSPFSISDDIDGDIRWGETGYTGTGTATDIGADETDGNSPTCNPPVFFQQPVSVPARCNSGTAIFTTFASGESTISYQWQVNSGTWTNISDGGSSPSYSGTQTTQLTITNATSSAQYRCLATNCSGANITPSNTATVIVNTPPVITFITPDKIKCSRDSVLFKVITTGAPSPGYQWKNSGGNITDATNNFYHIFGLIPSNAGIYSCDVSNICGNASASTMLSVNFAPVILDSIPDQGACLGASIIDTVFASGTGLKYQWTKGGANIPGATNTIFSLTDLKLTDADIYSCVVSNSCVSSRLKPFLLIINQKPIINIATITLTKNPGDSLSSVLSPGGISPFIYQWMNNNVNIPGATNNPFIIKPVLCSDAGRYSCNIINSCGSTKAQIFTLEVSGCGAITVSGIVTYDNTTHTTMTSNNVKNTNVILASITGEKLDSVITDNSGAYIFNNVNNGSYKIFCSSNKDWGGGNPLDALIVNRTYIGTYLFTDQLKAKAADVSNDKKINPTDALLINRRYVQSITRFPISDWLSDTATINVNDNSIIQNIQVICAGDVNGSLTPSNSIKIMFKQIDLNSEVINLQYGKNIDIPVYLNENTEVGALGLKLQITNNNIQFIDISSDLKDLIFNITHCEELSANNYQQINIAWSAIDEAYKADPEKPLFTIKAIYKGNPSIAVQRVSYLMFSEESILANHEGYIISTNKLEMPGLSTSNQISELNFQAYPNPFSSITNINYSIPDDANVSIKLYNVLGGKVASLTDAMQTSGQHSLQFDGSALRQGLYYCEMQVKNYRLQILKTYMLIIAR